MAQPISTNVDPGLVDKLSGKTPFSSSSSPAANWFPPLTPLTPIAPKDSPARALDYRTGVNLTINPRPDEVVTYSQMRYVAENCSLITMAVETRKDQMAKQRWDVRYRADAVTGMTSDKLKAKAQSDSRLKEIRAFLRKPDGETSWDGWLRKLVHEVLVTDSVALYKRRSLFDTPHSLLQIDGATITRKLNLDGTTPQPTDPDPVAYQQIIKGAPYVDFTTDELIYRPRNPRVNKMYGYSPVEQVIFLANMIMRRDLSKLNFYTDGNMPPALASVDDSWSADQIMEFQQKFDAVNQGDLAAMRRLQFIPKINSLHLLKQEVLKDDADEWFARLVMYAFSLPPTALTKQMNRATADSAEESALDEGLLPLMNWLKELITDAIESFFGYDDIEFVWVEEKLVDPKIQAEVLQIYVNQGIMSRNQAADKLGLDPIEGGDIFTVGQPGANGPVPLSEVTMSTQDKIDAGLMADPTIPKPSPFGASAGDPAKPAQATPEDTPAQPQQGKQPATDPQKKSYRIELAKHYAEILEDLNPELRDPLIVQKLMELERAEI